MLCSPTSQSLLWALCCLVEMEAANRTELGGAGGWWQGFRSPSQHYLSGCEGCSWQDPTDTALEEEVKSHLLLQTGYWDWGSTWALQSQRPMFLKGLSHSIRYIFYLLLDFYLTIVSAYYFHYFFVAVIHGLLPQTTGSLSIWHDKSLWTI